MRKCVFILILLISSLAKGQKVADINQIDTIVSRINFIASEGSLDTLTLILLTSNGSSSTIILLKKDSVANKISIIDKMKVSTETFYLLNYKPIFAEVIGENSSKSQYYFVGDSSYLKDGNKFNKGSSSYWFNLVDTYLSIFNISTDSKRKQQ